MDKYQWISRHNTLAVIVISGAFALVGSGLFYITYNNTDFWYALGAQIGIAFIAIGSLSFVWELFLTKLLKKEVYALIKMKDNFDSSGISEIYEDFSRIDWKPLFESVNKRLDLFFMMARTWTNNNRTLLDIIADKDVEVNVILPDLDDEKTKESLKYRLKPDYEIEDIERKITKIRETYEHIFSGKKAHLQIWYYQKPLVFSIYRFDDEVIFALNSHSGSPPVPAFKFKKGSIYEFLNEEIDFLTPEGDSQFSRKVYDNQN